MNQALHSCGKNFSDHIKWHRTQVTVQVSDTDYGGGVYHGRYFALYNVARDQCLADMGVPYLTLMHLGVNLSVAELHTQYLKPVHYGDIVSVWTRFAWMRHRSLGVVQKMVCQPPDSQKTLVKNRVEMNLVCTDSKGQAILIPDILTRAVQTYFGRSVTLAPSKAASSFSKNFGPP